MAFSLSSAQSGTGGVILPDYVFYYKSGRMYAQTDTGFTTSSTDAAAIINASMQNLTSGGTCRIKANANIPLIAASCPLVVPNNVHLVGLGMYSTRLKVSVADQNVELLKNNAAGDSIWISDLTLDANCTGYHAAYPIHFNGGGSGMNTLLRNVILDHHTGTGVYAEGSGGLPAHDWDSLYLQPASGCTIQRAYDTHIKHCNFNFLTLNGAGITTNQFVDIYLGGGQINNVLQITGDNVTYPNTMNLFQGIRCDNGWQRAASLEGYALGNIFSGCLFSNYDPDGTDNTYTCVHLQDNCLRNSFFGCYFGDNVVRAKKWKYLIEEANSSDYSFFGGCHFFDAGTAVTHTLGANTHVKGCMGQTDI